MLLHSLVDGHRRRGVADHRTHVDGQCGRRRYLAARDGGDELFLTALRILHAQRHNLDALVSGRQTAQMLDGIGLVVLHADIGALDTKRTLENRHAD